MFPSAVPPSSWNETKGEMTLVLISFTRRRFMRVLDPSTGRRMTEVLVSLISGRFHTRMGAAPKIRISPVAPAVAPTDPASSPATAAPIDIAVKSHITVKMGIRRAMVGVQTLMPPGPSCELTPKEYVTVSSLVALATVSSAFRQAVWRPQLRGWPVSRQHVSLRSGSGIHSEPRLH